MTANQGDGLQALRSFTVTADYHRDQTTFDVWSQGRGDPTARLYKRGPVLSLDRFDVLTGPSLDEHVGQVARNGAWAADGTQVGTITYKSSQLDKKLNRPWLFPSSHSGIRARLWLVEQPGLPPVSGPPSGAASRLRFNAITDALLVSDVLHGQNPVDYVAPFRFVFDMAGVPGFEIGRRAGRSRLRVSVREPRIDRRLVLACVVCINSLHNPTVRQTAVNLTTNPFKR
jgi:hypothetical protein